MINKKEYKFKSVIKKADDMDAAYIEFPYDAEKEFGKVIALFDGYEYKNENSMSYYRNKKRHK